MSNPMNHVDYISNLPDAILCDILSYLPTKAAVRTSVLSTKWKYFWTQAPALDFTDVLDPDPRPGSFSLRLLSDQQINYLKNFMDRALLLNNASYIKRFCLHFDFDLDLDSIKSWLDAVRWRKFGEVSIDLRWMELVLLPREFLCGSNLVALNLNGFRIDDLPPSFHLPNLETVHFGRHISFPFPGDQFLKRFVLSCPVLKELFIHSTVGFDETICIESLTLKFLEIRNIASRCQNFLCINIKAPNLRYLCLHGPALYKIGDLNMLTEADLYLRAYGCRKYIDQYTFQLMKKISGVRTLRFRISYVFRSQDKLPTFENLTHLRLQDDQCTSEILKYAPRLKSLIFEKVGSIAPVFDREAAHDCMTCLERVEFFLVKDSVLNFVEHFFIAATALKEMIFNLRGLVSTGRKEAVRERLMSLPMSSLICQITFVY